MSNDNPSKASKKRDLVFTRVFDAPLELVWKAWVEPEIVRQWWGPEGFTCPVAKIDFREGGTSLVCMRAPKEFGGQDMYNTWTYTKIVPMREIEYLLHFADKDGNRVDPVTMGLPPDMPQEVRNLVTFKAVGSKTELTVTEYDWTVSQMMEMSKMGMEQCLDKMAASFKTSKGENMASKIFVNLPVKNLNKSIEFFTKLGFSFNQQFTDETATCMIVTDDIFVMLLTEEKFKTFTPKEICDAKKYTEALVGLSLESRAKVDEMVRKAVAAGGATYNEPQDHGFMYGHGFQDLDGHIWELIYMEPGAVQ